MLMKMTQNGLASIYFKMMDKERKEETKIDRKYNLFDGFV